MWGKKHMNDTFEVEKLSLGEQIECPPCHAKYWEGERLCGSDEVPAYCCGRNVHVMMPQEGFFQPITDPRVHELYFGDSEDACHFRRHIRAYNWCLSPGVPRVRYENVSIRTEKTVAMAGQIKWIVANGTHADDDGLPSDQGQLYFLDASDLVAGKRASLSTDRHLRPDIIKLLQGYLEHHNDLVKCYKIAHEVHAETQQDSPDSPDVVAILLNPHRDGFRVTDRALFDDDPELRQPEDSKCIVGVFRGNRIPYDYDVALFPRQAAGNALLHLHTERPYLNIIEPSQRGKRLKRPVLYSEFVCTLRAYYSSRLMLRPDLDSGILFRTRTLYQQWLVCAALKIMECNMRFSEENQEEVQVCRQDALRRFVEDEADRRGKKPGRVVILPRYEQRSERRMHSEYMDAVTIAIEFGSPALFLTFTFNPGWPEVMQALADRGLSRSEYMHAPDICVRVFLARAGAFISDCVNKSIFGRTRGYVYVHEFTHTFLMHLHLCLILDPADRPQTAEDVDALVSAEIPRREENGNLHELVMKFMIHRPCDGSSPGYNNPRCRPDGPDKPCKHGFPFAFREKTVVTGHGAQLRRREEPGYYHVLYKCMVDNRWVVSFNSNSLERHLNHINATICGENMYFKYLFGYMQKEAHGAHVQGSMLRYAREQADEEFHWNEIAQFRDMRVVGPFEAVYRIFSVPMTGKSHHVESLPIHLPGKHLLYYKGDANLIDILDHQSQLLAWFTLNTEDESARDLYYRHIPQFYRWHKGKWEKRARRANNLANIMHVNPSPRQMELFHLRMLLLNRPGMTSFLDILTVNGKECGTFREACDALGLTSAEGFSYEDALDEVVLHGSPFQIRSFFATLIVNCFAANIQAMWIKHRDTMVKDFTRRRVPFNRALLLARRHILEIIRDSAEDEVKSVETLLTVPLGEDEDLFADIDPHEVVPDSQSESRLSQEIFSGCNVPEEQLPLEAFDHDSYYGDNKDQKEIHQQIMSAVQAFNVQNNAFLLLAPAGTGKTHLYKGLLSECKNLHIGVVASAYTGIAASLIPGAQTCHRTFGIGVQPTYYDMRDRSYLMQESEEAQSLINSRLILVDEVSMLTGVQLNVIDCLLRDLMNLSNVPFGGKVIILGGDMAQILPIVKNKGPTEAEGDTILAMDVVKEAKRVTLTRNMRAITDLEFSQWVATVRNGTANHSDDDLLIPDKFLIPTPVAKDRTVQTERIVEETIIKTIMNRVYGDLSQERLEKGVILCPKNDDVNRVNDIVLKHLPGDDTETTFYSVTKLWEPSSRNRNAEPMARADGTLINEPDLGEFLITQEELNAVDRFNIPPHRLALRVGSIVILLLNLNKRRGLCNGTRRVVTNIHSLTLQVRKIGDPPGEKEFFLPIMSMRTDDVPVAGTIERRQYPIRLAFAITINKSQGQSFDYVGLFLRKPVFSHGQFYVAVSRCKNGSNLCVGIIKGVNQGPLNMLRGGRRKAGNLQYFTKNIVI